MKVQLLPSWQAFTPGQASSCHCMQLLLHPVVTHLSFCKSKPFSPEPASTVQTQSQDSSSPWKLQNMLDVWKGVHADPKEERCCAEASEGSAGEAGSPLPPQQDLADEHPQVIWAPQFFVCQQMDKGLSTTEETYKTVVYSLPNTTQNLLDNRNSSQGIGL